MSKLKAPHFTTPSPHPPFSRGESPPAGASGSQTYHLPGFGGGSLLVDRGYTVELSLSPMSKLGRIISILQLYTPRPQQGLLAKKLHFV